MFGVLLVAKRRVDALTSDDREPRSSRVTWRWPRTRRGSTKAGAYQDLRQTQQTSCSRSACARGQTPAASRDINNALPAALYAQSPATRRVSQKSREQLRVIQLLDTWRDSAAHARVPIYRAAWRTR